ncbi:cyclic nucleotide-binding domain-containing protein [Leadbettera azotonutricia]|uniref:Cyclic nucleotide-binding protein n=1 Tax=Leadbettera azotonutricia (strain ATCC BAA-888 / DSM 13862 / ZAS-9) TaxID=545695 RepID=F5Y9F6_LEAAZ|nr:cyclic nucleotide-binding domain-containing protein [Leadbettera azotonutricia]AEF81269.1 cyclic nucleotide-binding protein [Leadbettera azotonutricia ZAS-9]
MAVLGVVNSDLAVKKLVEFAFRNEGQGDFSLRHLTEKIEILEFMSYDLPEVVIINFSDPSIKIDEIISWMKDDKWLMNFGIIGVFSQEKNNEEKLLEKYKAVNILTLMEYSRIRSHIVKNVQIIARNYQIIFAREFTKNLMDGASGSFLIENDLLAVPLYAGMGATLLSQRGLIDPDNKMHLQLALGELIVNAVEHGNCGIGYDEKTEGMEKGLSVVDLVAEKCKDPAIRGKKVEFQWELLNDKSIFIIKDEGKGFDVKAHLQKIENQDIMSLHGRGIKLASKLSNELSYNAKGNQVTLTVKHDLSLEYDVPLGFSKEQIVNVKPGDIILKEGEPSDYLYYISSGRYTVFHNRKQVGTLSPEDIFMGEMSFLLNQKRSATVRAETTGKLILLTRKAFVNVIRQFPHYGIFLSKLLAKRLVRGNDRNAALMDKLKSAENSAKLPTGQKGDAFV